MSSDNERRFVHRRGSGETCSTGSQDDVRFVDPIAQLLATSTAAEQATYSRSGGFRRVVHPWYLFQYVMCCIPCCSRSPKNVSPTTPSPQKYSSVLDEQPDVELIAQRMRVAARLTMLLTAFFVAIAQWAALASGVKLFEGLVGLTNSGASAMASAAFAVCFLSSIAGGVLGDALWGNAKTLFTGLVGALLASTVLAIVSFPQLEWTTSAGGHTVVALCLFVFALAVGICQTAIPNLIGDQCHMEPERLQGFYNMYYALIQGGAFISRILFPIIHNQLDWFIAICLCVTAPIAVALLVFTMNSAVLAYRTPTAQVHAWQAFLIVARRIVCCAPTDELQVRYGEETVDDADRASSVLKLHLPLPIFWGLYFQMFELWYLQAEELDLRIFGTTSISAEQATALNPLFDVMLLLCFTYCFNRLKGSMEIDVRATTKILIGYMCATAAFAYGIWLQVRVARAASGSVTVWFQLPQYLLLCAAEVLVYPAALHEVYLHSPPAIRSFVQSCLWFFIGIGNTLNVIVLTADSQLEGSNSSDTMNLTPLFIGYTAAMGFATLVFAYLRSVYHRRQDSSPSANHEQPSSSSHVEVRTQAGTEASDISNSSFQQGQSVPPTLTDESQRLLGGIANQQQRQLPPPERRIPISPRTTTSGQAAVYHSTRKSPRGSMLTSGELPPNMYAPRSQQTQAEAE